MNEKILDRSAAKPEESKTGNNTLIPINSVFDF
jgi:hypothetical protein